MSTFDSVLTPNDQPSYEKYKRVLLLGEADFSFTRAFATYAQQRQQQVVETLRNEDRKIEIIATEYGDSCSIASRYYENNTEKFCKSLGSLHDLESVACIGCGLNARLLGDKSCTWRRWNNGKQGWENPSSFWNVGNDDNKLNKISNENHYRNKDSIDLIIFNFPHTEQAGRATKLVRALFRQLRICIDDNRLPPNVELEMRLRSLETDLNVRKKIRAFYNHEEAAEESRFELIGNWPSDLKRWEALGYKHKWTRRNATCLGIGDACQVWRWRPFI